MVLAGGYTFFAFPAKEGRKWISKQVALTKSIMISGEMKFLPPLPLSGIPSSTKLRYNKRLFSSSQSSTRQGQLMNGEVKSSRRLTKIALTAAHSWSSRWSIDCIAVYSLNKGGDTLSTSCGNSLLKRGKLGPHKSFSTMQCLFDQPLCKTLQ